MDTRKVTLVATIAVIALLAVGIGYAYTATTVNDSNSAQSEHVVLTQANTAYTFVKNETGYNSNYTVYYDTINTGTGATDTKYILMSNGTSATKAAPISGIKYDTNKDYYGLALGKTSTLTATYTGATNPTSYGITVSSTNVTVPTGWYAIITFVESTNVQYAVTENGTVWTYHTADGTSESKIVLAQDGQTNTSKTYTTTLYYCAKDLGTDGYGSSTTAPGANPLNSAKISFEYTTNTPTP